MTDRELLSGFFKKAEQDRRIGIAHIGLYAVLVELWARNNFSGSVRVFSGQIKPIAKLYSRKTYYRLLQDLHNYSYLRYEPSTYCKKPSLIKLNLLNPEET